MEDSENYDQPYDHFKDILRCLGQENLFFFCGAGISMPALPSFEKLCKDLIHGIHGDISLLKPYSHYENSLKTFLEGKQYDKLVEFLETMNKDGKSFDENGIKEQKNKIYKELKEILRTDNQNIPEIHKIIIDIFKKEKNH